jgi:hypothetical protein
VPWCSWFYWGWDDESADTGGIIADQGYYNLNWFKIDYLRKVGLVPWYISA